MNIEETFKNWVRDNQEEYVNMTNRDACISFAKVIEKQLLIHSVVESFYCHYKNADNAPNCKKSCAFCKDKEKELQ